MDAHQRYMTEALALAERARAAGEVPVGAVVVVDGEIVGRGHNAPLLRSDPTAHAEVLAIRDAAAVLGNYRLLGATLYCTVEPCLMCFGAAMHARIVRLVYGASDRKVGAASRLDDLRRLGADFNHRIEVIGGVAAEPAAELLLDFFRKRRAAGRLAVVGNGSELDNGTERYRSGRNGGASKASCPGNRARGFESPPLRHSAAGAAR